MNNLTTKDLRILQALPLERKIGIAQARIAEFYNEMGGQVSVSFSGGKDSTVLLHIVRSMYPDVPAIFCNTGLEYPEIVDFVKGVDNVTIIKPKMSFKKTLMTYGYPVVSKDVAIRLQRNKHGELSNSGKMSLAGLTLTGEYSEFRQRYKKWEFLKDAPFKISSKCCSVLKKNPFKPYNSQYLGTRCDESQLRQQKWVEHGGCNVFGKDAKSMPLSVWTGQDILQYIKIFKLNLASVYGDVIEDYDTGLLRLTGLERTGCMFCLFGAHLEKLPNKFQRMAITHPLQYDYCLRPIERGGLGLKEVLDFLGVQYRPIDTIEKYLDTCGDNK